MKFWRRSIDIFKDPSRIVRGSRTVTAGGHALIVSLPARERGLVGWYRLKYLFHSHQPQRIAIRALGPDLSQIAEWHASNPGERLAGYVNVPRNAASLEMRFDFGAENEALITAKLRPISIVEQIWRLLTRVRGMGPKKHFMFFRRSEDDFIVFGFPPSQTPSEYQRWIANTENKIIQAHPQAFSTRTGDGPQITILLYVRRARAALLKKTLESIRTQTSQHWRLLIVDDACRNPAIMLTLEIVALVDPRIEVKTFMRFRGVSAALNFMLSKVSTRYLARIDESDELARHAIETCSRQLGTTDGCELLFSDEDVIDPKGHRSQPYFKPRAFSPELLRSYNYLNRLTVYDTEIVRSVGGWRSNFDGAEDYDLTLRIVERLPLSAITHVTMVLYHRRQSPEISNPTVRATDAVVAGQRALAAYFSRQSIDASVEIVLRNRYRIRYSLPQPRSLVSIIVPFRDRAGLLDRCLQSIFDKTTYGHFEILLINNGSTELETHALLEKYRSQKRIRMFDVPIPFNYSALNNFAAREARGEFFCFLNNDTEVISPDWLEEMVGHASQPQVACVGPKLYYKDGTIQHAGILLGLPSWAEHAFRRFSADNEGYFGRLMVASNYSALTGACIVVRREKFWQIGGFDESLPVTFNDIDFCVKLLKLGYRHVFTPFAQLFHFEASTRGVDVSAEQLARFQNEIAIMRSRFGNEFDNDPNYSPHLTHRKTDFSIRLDEPNEISIVDS